MGKANRCLGLVFGMVYQGKGAVTTGKERKDDMFFPTLSLRSTEFLPTLVISVGKIGF